MSGETNPCTLPSAGLSGGKPFSIKPVNGEVIAAVCENNLPRETSLITYTGEGAEEAAQKTAAALDKVLRNNLLEKKTTEITSEGIFLSRTIFPDIELVNLSSITSSREKSSLSIKFLYRLWSSGLLPSTFKIAIEDGAPHNFQSIKDLLEYRDIKLYHWLENAQYYMQIKDDVKAKKFAERITNFPSLTTARPAYFDEATFLLVDIYRIRGMKTQDRSEIDTASEILGDSYARVMPGEYGFLAKYNLEFLKNCSIYQVHFGEAPENICSDAKTNEYVLNATSKYNNYSPAFWDNFIGFDALNEKGRLELARKNIGAAKAAFNETLTIFKLFEDPRLLIHLEGEEKDAAYKMLEPHFSPQNTTIAKIFGKTIASWWHALGTTLNRKPRQIFNHSQFDPKSLRSRKVEALRGLADAERIAEIKETETIEKKRELRTASLEKALPFLEKAMEELETCRQDFGFDFYRGGAFRERDLYYGVAADLAEIHLELDNLSQNPAPRRQTEEKAEEVSRFYADYERQEEEPSSLAEVNNLKSLFTLGSIYEQSGENFYLQAVEIYDRIIANIHSIPAISSYYHLLLGKALIKKTGLFALLEKPEKEIQELLDLGRKELKAVSPKAQANFREELELLTAETISIKAAFSLTAAMNAQSEIPDKFAFLYQRAISRVVINEFKNPDFTARRLRELIALCDLGLKKDEKAAPSYEKLDLAQQKLTLLIKSNQPLTGREANSSIEEARKNLLSMIANSSLPPQQKDYLNSRVYLVKAEAFFEEEDYADALKEINSITTAAQNPRVDFLKGKVLIVLGEKGENEKLLSGKDLLTRLEADPNTPQFYKDLAALALATAYTSETTGQETARHINRLDRIASFKPDDSYNAERQVNLGRFYLFQSDPEKIKEIIPIIAAAISSLPPDSYLYLQGQLTLAKLYQANNKPTEAQTALKVVIDQDKHLFLKTEARLTLADTQIAAANYLDGRNNKLNKKLDELLTASTATATLIEKLPESTYKNQLDLRQKTQGLTLAIIKDIKNITPASIFSQIRDLIPLAGLKEKDQEFLRFDLKLKEASIYAAAKKPQYSKIRDIFALQDENPDATDGLNLATNEQKADYYYLLSLYYGSTKDAQKGILANKYRHEALKACKISSSKYYHEILPATINSLVNPQAKSSSAPPSREAETSPPQQMAQNGRPDASLIKGPDNQYLLPFDHENLWQKSGGMSGGSFNNAWWEDRVTIEKNSLSLKLDREDCPLYCYNLPFASGEYSTTAAEYGYGYYEARFKPAKGAGLVGGSFFVYTGEQGTKSHYEIDIEILGKDTNQAQFTLWIGGRKIKEETVSLGFDAATGFHNYGFSWKKDSIKWFVDGKPAASIYGTFPENKGKIMLNLWAGTGQFKEWLGGIYNGKEAAARYEWVKHSPFK